MSSGTVYLKVSMNCRFSDSLDRAYFWCQVRLGLLWRGMSGISSSDIAHYQGTHVLKVSFNFHLQTSKVSLDEFAGERL